MTEHKITPDAPIFVAIDTAKHRHEILIEVPGKKRRRRLTIQNTLEDYNRLVALLTDYGGPARVAFEACDRCMRALTACVPCRSTVRSASV
jgi:hypothetical protein